MRINFLILPPHLVPLSFYVNVGDFIRMPSNCLTNICALPIIYSPFELTKMHKWLFLTRKAHQFGLKLVAFSWIWLVCLLVWRSIWLGWCVALASIRFDEWHCHWAPFTATWLHRLCCWSSFTFGGRQRVYWHLPNYFLSCFAASISSSAQQRQSKNNSLNNIYGWHLHNAIKTPKYFHIFFSASFSSLSLILSFSLFLFLFLLVVLFFRFFLFSFSSAFAMDRHQDLSNISCAFGEKCYATPR